MEAVTCSVNDAAKALSIGRVTLYKLIDQGKVESVRIGGRRLIKVASIHRLVDEAKAA